MREKEENPVADRAGHKFTLRLTEELHQVIFARSAREGRSVNTEILLRLAQTVDDEHVAKVRESRTHLGVIEFLASSVEELAGLLTEEQRGSERVKVMLDLARRLSAPEVRSK